VIRFILVHGTFAKSADWPSLCASLTALAHRLGEEATFDTVLWTGKNSIAARQRAGDEILDKVQGMLESRGEYSELGNNKIILIGHSHGGSAIAYFLKQWPDYADLVAGYIFLSTPFIAIRPRLNATKIMGVLLILPVGSAYFAMKQAFAPGDGILDWVWTLSWYQLFPLLLPFLLSSLLLNLTRRSEKKFAALARSQTVDIPPVNALFVRFSGDEAAAALSAVQFLSWAASKASRAIELVLHPPFVPSGLRQFFGAVVMAPLFIVATYQVATRMLPPLMEVGVVRYFEVLTEVFRTETIGIGNLIALMIIVLASIISAVFFTIVLTVFVTLALTLKGFGWTGFFDGFVVELAVDPVPCGSRQFVSLDWSARTDAAGDMVHSWGYSHPAAMEEIDRFVRTAVSR
jgi:pimeloyl-ACP methyl ester carboxylesterase